jgi:hypothetical protein
MLERPLLGMAQNGVLKKKPNSQEAESTIIQPILRFAIGKIYLILK